MARFGCTVCNWIYDEVKDGYPMFGVSFPNPNFARFAESCGGEGYRIEDPKH